MLSKSVADFMCSYFAILDLVRLQPVLRCYGPESDFTCVNYLDWGFNFATKIAVNGFFNNKQTIKRYSL